MVNLKLYLAMVQFLQSKQSRKDVQVVHTLEGGSIHLAYPRKEKNNRNQSVCNLNLPGRIWPPFFPLFFLLAYRINVLA